MGNIMRGNLVNRTVVACAIFLCCVSPDSGAVAHAYTWTTMEWEGEIWARVNADEGESHVLWHQDDIESSLAAARLALSTQGYTGLSPLTNDSDHDLAAFDAILEYVPVGGEMGLVSPFFEYAKNHWGNVPWYYVTQQMSYFEAPSSASFDQLYFRVKSVPGPTILGIFALTLPGVAGRRRGFCN